MVSNPGADPRRWRVLGVTLTVGFMVLLDVTIVNVALPSMRAALGASPGAIQWVVSGYALAFGLTLVLGGRLGDAYGRRRLMQVGLIGFVLASAAAGLAPTTETLVAARLVQGCAAGLLTPQSSGLIQSLFRGPERGTAFGIFGLTVSISSALGPIIGGLIIAAVGPEQGWRWIFLVNVPIGAVLLLAIRRIIPAHLDDQSDDARLDPVGAVLLGATVLCLLYPIVSLESGQRLPLVLLPGVPVLAYAFTRWERRVVARAGAPLLDLPLLRGTPGYASGLAIGTLYFSGFTGVFLVLSVFLQEGLERSALATGLLLTPFAVGSAIASPIAGRLVSRVGRVLTVIALGTMMTALAVLAVAVPVVPDRYLSLLLVVGLAIAGLGGGAVVSPNFTLTLAEVPTRMGGAAGGALQTGQRIGAAIGAAVVASAYHLGAARADAEIGLRVALATSLVILTGAFVAAVWSWRHEAAPPGPGSEAAADRDRGRAPTR